MNNRESAITTRPAHLEDVPQLLHLCLELGYPAMEEEIETRLRRFAGTADRAVLVAEANGVVVGWIHVFATEHLQSAAFAEVGGLVVSQGFRRRGAARRLVSAAVEWSSAAGYLELRVRSNLTRQEAHRFYPALGFRRIKDQAIYSLPLGESDRRAAAALDRRRADR